MDSRVIPITKDTIIEYLSWRQDTAWRNCLNSYGYYTLLSNGYNKIDAAEYLKGKKEEYLHELLFNYGININEVPTWQRRGVMIYRKPDEKIARLKVVQDWEIPIFKSNEGKILLNDLLKS